jgi:hypothetical protein
MTDRPVEATICRIEVIAVSTTKEGQLRVDWKYADDFKRAYVTNSFCVGGDYDSRIIFGLSNIIMQQEATSMPKAQGDYKVEVILPFRALKELRNGLDEAIKGIETRLGEIKLPKKPEDYFKQP